MIVRIVGRRKADGKLMYAVDLPAIGDVLEGDNRVDDGEYVWTRVLVEEES